MKNILLPTDFSESANNAFLYALKIANQLHAKLYVLHSYQAPILSFSHAGQPEIIAEVYNEIEISNFDKYKDYTKKLHKLAEENGLDYTNVILLFEEGTVIDTVKETIDSENVDLIIMGTLGASGFKKVFIGTNTVNVIQNVKVPVLAIPQKATYHGIKKIAFTTLFRETDLKPLKDTLDLAKSFESEVYCTHVISSGNDAGNILQHTEHWRKELQQQNLDFILLEKDETIEYTINNFIDENNIDVLAIVKRNRSFFDKLINSSLSNNLAFHAKTPILIFSEEK